jgi:hypothetical protein
MQTGGPRCHCDRETYNHGMGHVDELLTSGSRVDICEEENSRVMTIDGMTDFSAAPKPGGIWLGENEDGKL